MRGGARTEAALQRGRRLGTHGTANAEGFRRRHPIEAGHLGIFARLGRALLVIPARISFPAACNINAIGVARRGRLEHRELKTDRARVARRSSGRKEER
jgi:hypothetical protein